MPKTNSVGSNFQVMVGFLRTVSGAKNLLYTGVFELLARGFKIKRLPAHELSLKFLNNDECQKLTYVKILRKVILISPLLS
jgi:hypothetical protein